MKKCLLALFACLFIAHLFGNEYYTVKFPNDTAVYGCGAAIPTTYPTINMTGNCNFAVGVAVDDQIFYAIGTQSCGKVLRRFRLLYWCDFNPNWSPNYIPNPYDSDLGPTVTGNSYNHGYLEYTQIIKFVDNVPPVFLNCPAQPVVFCDYTGNDPNQYHTNYHDLCEGPANLSIKVTDACSKSSIWLSYRLFLDLDGNGSMETIKYSSDTTAWPIEKSILNDTLRAFIKFPVGFGLPYGKHKVEWIANDNCGNNAICKYEFTIKDCKAPTVVCHNGLSVNIMQTGMITLWASDFLHYTYDNCTPTEQIKIGIRKSGTGTGFPNNSTSATFDCTEVGVQYVDIWASDAYGNADFCQTFVNVQDNWNICPPVTPPPPDSGITFSGKVANDQHQAMFHAPLRLRVTDTTSTSNWLVWTDSLGKYTFTDVPACGTTWSVLADSVHKHHGITTMDVLLAANEIAGAYTPASPYRIIATDVNRDNVLNDSDLMGIIEMVISPTTPGAGPWRFVPRYVVFADTTHPLATPIPDKIVVNCPQAMPANTDFVAIAMGDLDGSATTTQAQQDAADRDGTSSIAFTSNKKTFKMGDLLTVPIMTPDLDGLSGFQFTLGFDPSVLSLEGVEPSLVPSNWIGAYPALGKVAVSWHTTALGSPSAKGMYAKAFTLTFRALQDGVLEQSLSMNAEIAAAEAYSSNWLTQTTSLRFEGGKTKDRSMDASRMPIFEAAKPNPSMGISTVAFYLPEDGEIGFTLTDISGRVLQMDRNFFLAGHHAYQVNCPSKGILLLKMDSEGGTLVQKIIVH